MARSARQAGARWLSNVGGAQFLGIEISVGRDQLELIECPGAQLAFHALGSCLSQIERFKKSVESNQIRQVIMKIRSADGNPLVPQSLLDTSIPTKAFLRLQCVFCVESKDFVLTARRTESGRNTRVQCCVGLVDLVTASEAIGPNVAELIEMSVTSARGQNEIRVIDGRFQKPGFLLGVIADELRPK